MNPFFFPCKYVGFVYWFFSLFLDILGMLSVFFSDVWIEFYFNRILSPWKNVCLTRCMAVSIIWLTKPLFLTFLSFFLISQLLAEFSFYVTGFYKYIADLLSILETFFPVFVIFISRTWIHSLASPTFLFVESFIIFPYKPVKFSSDV